MRANKNTTTGITGVYFVAAELSRNGYIATVTFRNTEIFDILVSSHDGSKTRSVQVKTSSPDAYERSWQMSKKHEDICFDNLFYVFVHLNKEGMPDFYIVQSKDVSEYLKNIYPVWKKTRAEKDKAKEKSDIRLFEISDGQVNKYHNRWSDLGLD